MSRLVLPDDDDMLPDDGFERELAAPAGACGGTESHELRESISDP
jgi:hypothetical protein